LSKESRETRSLNRKGEPRRERREVDRLFVAYKPPFVSSNSYLGHLKWRYGAKSGGFSGTLDPFASGVMVVAFGRFTRLFRFLNKAPKTYRAVLYLGAQSPTLDLEGITKVSAVPPVSEAVLLSVLTGLQGDRLQTPPAYSAKRVQGRRAYDLAREGETVALAPVPVTIHDLKLLNCRHPFVTFEATVSEGTYIRVLGEEIALALGCDGALVTLERLREGEFIFDGERALDPLAHLRIPENRFLGPERMLTLGQKLPADSFEKQEEGAYIVAYQENFSIIEIQEGRVNYLLNNQSRRGRA